MQIFYNFQKLRRPSAVALGMFDGVHLGHQKVIRAAAASPGELAVTVLTFTTLHARPEKKSSQKDILSLGGKLDRLETLGVEYVYVPDFDSIKNLEAQDFVSYILKDRLNAKVVCCGEDFRFGKKAAGDVDFLIKSCQSYGIEVQVISAQMDGDSPVSSTRIRRSLMEGDICSANRLLGYPYFIKGIVIYGKQIGRTIGCPTLNQEIPEGNCIPKFGVYASTTLLDGVAYPSITNIGTKPTIKGERLPLAETHVIGIDRILYGQEVTVNLYKFIRGETKFESLGELSSHIQNDIKTAKLFLKSPGKQHID